ncbi:hypothetical protein [Kordiimonas aquimaris]|uniref:hypothetical protein n=1 Tax=Kordiimonas aquimaris TaxID=707591 RepID=UPI0021CEC942|nr:hypothetical protein [Kordiimonas aquimaris]
MSRSIRDIFSSTTKGAALGAMILGSVASPITASANDLATDHPGAAEITYAQNELAQAKKSVGLRDSRKFDKDVVRTATARASNDRIALALYGANGDDLNQARLGVWDAKQEGINVGGIVVGSPKDQRAIDVYGDGYRWMEHEIRPDQNVREATFAFIKYADSSMKKLNAELASTGSTTLASATYDND